jgi:flagellin FlaB
MTSKLNRLFKDESGITALETAIILIAFVVVASVFAFTILSAGTASTERGEAAIYAGLEQVEGSMEVLGGVTAKADSVTTPTQVAWVEFTLTSAAGGGAIDLTQPTDNKVVIDYFDEVQHETNITWSTEWLVCGESTCDNLLEEDEQVLVKIPLTSTLTVSLTEDTDFVFEIKPPQGGVIPIEKRTPAALSGVMDLN